MKKYSEILSEVLEIAVRRFRPKATETQQTPCVWYKSISLIDNNQAYEMCHHNCDGYGSGCNNTMYTPKLTEDNKLCERDYD